MGDLLKLGNRELKSRLLLGTARYPTAETLKESIITSESDVITVSLRRESQDGQTGQGFWNLIKDMGCHILPNTAGCYSIKEAITTAHMARDLFDTNWIKLEVIGNHETLQPDVFATVEAARILSNEGYEVFPYTTSDLVVAEKLMDAGCRIIMPWAAPIGTGQGPTDIQALESLRARLPEATLIVDAGLGLPSHAANVMEMGFDAVLLNTAVSCATHPIQMAKAFKLGVQSGRQAYLAGPMAQRKTAVPSTPEIGTPFWHHRSTD
jgi:thiazole synthase